MSRRIAFINSSKTWGGGEKWHLENAIALQNRGFNVEIICRINSELHKECLENGIHIRIMDTKNFSFINPKKLKLASEILEDFDVAILNLPSDLKLFGKANKGKCKLIYRRGSAIPIKNNKLNNDLLNKKIELIIANSEATKNTILENGVLEDKDKIEVIYNGIIVPYEHHIKEIEPKLILGNLGRLVEQKNQSQLIDIAKILDEKNIDFELLIGGDGNLKTKIQNKINKNDLGEKVKLIGEVTDVEDFYRSIDVFLLTSKWEGFGYVIAESFSFKKPVVTFNVSSNPELITNNENGFLITPFSSEIMAEKIIELSENRKRIKEMGESGYNFIKEKRSFTQSINRLISVLEKI